MERDQLALSQSADQFQIEHRQGITPLGGVQIRADVVWVKDFHLLFFNFGDDAILRGIAENEFFFHRPVKGIVQHQVETADGRAAELWAAVTALAVDTPILHQLLVELLQIVGGQLGELDIADTGNGVLLDHELVTIGCGDADVWLCVNVVPASQPSGDGIFIGAVDVDALD